MFSFQIPTVSLLLFGSSLRIILVPHHTLKWLVVVFLLINAQMSLEERRYMREIKGHCAEQLALAPVVGTRIRFASRG